MARTGLALLIAASWASPSWACSVPLFRYALERWPPSAYELVVFHRGPLSGADRDRVHAIRAASRAANLKVTTADVGGHLGSDLAPIWARELDAVPVPLAVLRYPDSGPQAPPLWAGRLAEAPVSVWLDSPARRALFDRLTAGYAGVVLLLLSGDAAADDAARAVLREELPRIAGRIDLPARTEDGPQVLSELPVRVEFPVVEVPRTPGEDGLVRLLLGSDDGLNEVRGPIAFPVFGRGRALCSLHGKDLQQPAELRRSLEYICRACSCQVKELNPGLDLVMSGDWDIIFEAERGPPPREVSASHPPVERRGERPAAVNAAEARSPPPPGYDAAELDRHPGSPTARTPWPRYTTVGAIALALVSGSWALGRRGRVVGGSGRPASARDQ
jgi:hypothetical protein